MGSEECDEEEHNGFLKAIILLFVLQERVGQRIFSVSANGPSSRACFGAIEFVPDHAFPRVCLDMFWERVRAL